MGDLSEHFSRSEFACKCGGKYCSPIFNNVDPRLVEICEKVRVVLNCPVRINSGCRCLQHNKNSGGVANSAHTYGFAADLSSEAGSEAIFRVIQVLHTKGEIPNLRPEIYQEELRARGR